MVPKLFAVGGTRAHTQHQTRVRADIDRVVGSEDGYGHVYTSVTVKLDPDGAALTSMLPDGRHAPVVDIDRPVSVARNEHGSVVTVTGLFIRRSAADGLQELVRSGLLHPDTMTLAARSYTGWRRHLWLMRRVTFVMPFDVVVVPSATPGHCHLLVQEAMSWDDMKYLLRMLSYVGVADGRFANISSRGDFAYTFTPPGAYDTI